MRKLKISILATSIVFIAGMGISKAQNAEDIIKKHIEAVGGEANWNKIKTVKLVGSASAQGQEIGFTETISDKKGMRTDLSVMGQSGYIIITPSEAWTYMPFGGQTKPQSVPMDQVKDQLYQLEVKHLQYADRSFFKKCEYVGNDTVNQVSCFKLKIPGDAGEQTAYVDSKSYYLVRLETKVKIQGEDQDISQDFSNFQKQPEGIVIPMTLSNPMMGGDVNFKSVEINKTIDDAVFKPDTK